MGEFSHEPSLVEEALDTTIRDLGVGYLDLYLMHWPVASIHGENKIYYLQVSELHKPTKRRSLLY